MTSASDSLNSTTISPMLVSLFRYFNLHPCTWFNEKRAVAKACGHSHHLVKRAPQPTTPGMESDGLKPRCGVWWLRFSNQGLAHILLRNLYGRRGVTPGGLTSNLVSSWCEGLQTDLMIHGAIWFLNHSVVGLPLGRCCAVSWKGFHLFKMRSDEGLLPHRLSECLKDTHSVAILLGTPS